MTSGVAERPAYEPTYDRVRIELVDAETVTVTRYWPREIYETYRNAPSS